MKEHLLLLLALELLVIELGGAALVGGKVTVHGVSTPGQGAPFLNPDKLKGRRASRDDPPNMVSGRMAPARKTQEG